jgi:1-phosphatidylinositol-3-phosphate 5-kinase
MANTIKKLQRVAGNQSVSSLAKHFDELSRQYEKEEIKRRKRFGYRRALPVTSAKPKVEVFSNVQDIYQEASDDEMGTEMEALSANHSRKSTLKGPDDVPSEVLNHQTAEEASSQDAPLEADTNDIATSAAGVMSKVIDETMESSQEGGNLAAMTPPEESHPIPPEDAKESVSLMKAITNLWADRSAALWKPLEYPLYVLLTCL